jgi:hypothetical protein
MLQMKQGRITMVCIGLLNIRLMTAKHNVHYVLYVIQSTIYTFVKQIRTIAYKQLNISQVYETAQSGFNYFWFKLV